MRIQTSFVYWFSVFVCIICGFILAFMGMKIFSTFVLIVGGVGTFFSSLLMPERNFCRFDLFGDKDYLPFRIGCIAIMIMSVCFLLYAFHLLLQTGNGVEEAIPYIVLAFITQLPGAICLGLSLKTPN